MPKPKRKLAAIVSTDIVGFIKLTAENQSKASKLLSSKTDYRKVQKGNQLNMGITIEHHLYI